MLIFPVGDKYPFGVIVLVDNPFRQDTAMDASDNIFRKDELGLWRKDEAK